jgi:formylglycine-generating enzyme required for sulfatase activity
MHIFISYAKAETYNLAIQMRDDLRNIAGVTVWVDETLEPGESWALQIQQEIDAADYVVVLLSPDVNRPISGRQHRSFVLNEIDYAQQEHKIIIPIMAQPTRVPVQIAGIQYIDFTTDYAAGMSRLIRKIERHAAKAQPAILPTPVSDVSPDDIPYTSAEIQHTQSDNIPTKPAYRGTVFIIGILGLVVALAVIVVLPMLSPTTPSKTLTPSESLAPTVDESSQQLGQTPTAVANAFETQTAQGQDSQQTANADSTNVVDTQTAQAHADARETDIAVTGIATQSDLTLTPVVHNTDWTPVFQTFDGAEMALVPPGCFLMGRENGSNDESPVYRQCFDKPFWIDRYEVTNQAFGSEGYFRGDQRPRDAVTWVEARDYCAARSGARLPTEREWEYAARGPDHLIYPWSDDFVEENSVHIGNSNDQSADVGSRPAGDSWVGASDLIGNLWEWVSSLYQGYPYVSDDGRENPDSSDPRVLRGGSWGVDSSLLAATFRRTSDQIDQNNTGFRCARDY